MNRQALLARSYRPALADRILLRSTGWPPPAAALPEGYADRPSVHSPPPRREYPRASRSGLSSRVLKRLERYDNHILRYSRMNGLDPNLVRAVIYVESSGDPDAVSSRGARGLMQLMPATVLDMGVSNPFDPAQNIFGGTRYLGRLLDRFKRLDLALWAYNAGPEAVKRKHLPMETKRYIPEVLRIKSILGREES